MMKIATGRNTDFPFFSALFVSAALWNLIGAGFGYFNPEFTFHGLFGRELKDPLILAVYRGSWGTTLLYFFGYLIVAYNPGRHTGIVLLGTIGKVFFALKMAELYITGIAGNAVMIIVAGDAVFTLLFVYYLIFMMRRKEGII